MGASFYFEMKERPVSSEAIGNHAGKEHVHANQRWAGTICSRLAWNSTALDIKFQNGYRYLFDGPQPRLVHIEPRHIERDLLSSGRPGLHA
jgi:hypothetical protein